MSNSAINWAKSIDKPKGHKAVLFVMADSANKYMATWPSRATISKRTGYKEETVRDYQNAMVKDGTLIAVPWQTEKGADASPGYFLGCVRELFDELPPLGVAFAARIDFKGKGRGGRPRGFTPDWWSGKRVGGGHKCTACGGVCHGGEVSDETLAGTLLDVGLTSTVDPGEGRKNAPLEGRNGTTLPGGRGIDPFNPKESKPEAVVQSSRALTEVRARSVEVENQPPLSPSGGSGGRGVTPPWRTPEPSVDAASADAAAGDGLRPRGFAAPARRMDQLGIGDEEQPPPVAEVLKSAAKGEPSQRPGVGDLVPKKIQKAQQAYGAPATTVRPPRWRRGQEARRDEEWNRIVLALMDIDDGELGRLETAMLRVDLAAVSQGRAQAAGELAKRDRDEEPEPARLRRGRLYGLIYALRLRPLASWPEGVLPPALCGSEAATEAA